MGSDRARLLFEHRPCGDQRAIRKGVQSGDRRNGQHPGLIPPHKGRETTSRKAHFFYLQCPTLPPFGPSAIRRAGGVGPPGDQVPMWKEPPHEVHLYRASKPPPLRFLLKTTVAVFPPQGLELRQEIQTVSGSFTASFSGSFLSSDIPHSLWNPPSQEADHPAIREGPAGSLPPAVPSNPPDRIAASSNLAD